MEGGGLPGGSIIYQGHLFSKKENLWARCVQPLDRKHIVINSNDVLLDKHSDLNLPYAPVVLTYKVIAQVSLTKLFVVARHTSWFQILSAIRVKTTALAVCALASPGLATFVQQKNDAELG